MLHGIKDGRADDRISPDADAGGLTDPKPRELIHGLVCKRSAAADDSHMALLVNDRA